MLKVRNIAFALLIIAAVLLVPVSYAMAEEIEETAGGYSEDVPYLQGIEVTLERNDSNFVGWITGQVNKHRSISNMTFEFDRLAAVDYTEYEIVFDFELRSLLEDGTVSVHSYSYVSEIGEENGPGFFNNILISLTLKDDYLTQTFTYLEVIKNSPNYQSRLADSYAIVGGTGNYAHNTVVSQVDCYLREKATGNYGLVSRFSFVWDENFWNQLCSGITYKLIIPETEEVLSSEGTQNSLFAGNLDSEGTSWFQDATSLISRFGEFIVDLPEILYVFITGIIDFSAELVDLLKLMFPFIPGIIWTAIGALLILTVIIVIWKFVKGE